MSTDADGLGPLPAPHMRERIATAANTSSVRRGYEQGGYVKWPDMYTADHMRDYALQEVAAERERWAAWCRTKAEGIRRCYVATNDPKYLAESAVLDWVAQECGRPPTPTASA